MYYENIEGVLPLELLLLTLLPQTNLNSTEEQLQMVRVDLLVCLHKQQFSSQYWINNWLAYSIELIILMFNKSMKTDTSRYRTD